MHEALHLIHPPGRDDDADGEGGLAMCSTIVRRYGGGLWVQPRAAGGTSVFAALCTDAANTEEVEVTVQFQGRDMGRIGVTSLSNKQQITGRALDLPGLRHALDDRAIKDVVFVDAGVVKVVA